MTWSMEDVLVGVITAPAKISNAARVIGRITRPPKVGSDVDVRLVGFSSCGRDMESYAEGFNEGYSTAYRHERDIPDECPNCEAAIELTDDGDPQCSGNCGQFWVRDYCPDETPNPTEPGLTDDELVAVRGLIQERYDSAVKPHSAATTETSAADGPADLATPPSGSAGQPDAEERICVVLAEHQFRWASHDSIGSDAHCSCGFRPRDPQIWRWHVAPLIAEKLGLGPSSFETGHDMGVSAASELFPQHTKK